MIESHIVGTVLSVLGALAGAWWEAIIVIEYINFLVFQTIAMALTALLLPRLEITNVFGALGAVLALALINATLWDAALFFSLPDSVSLKMIALLLINGILFWIIAKVLPGIEVSGIAPALAAPLVFTVCSMLVDRYGRNVDWLEVYRVVEAVFAGLRDFVSDAPSAPGSEPGPLGVSGLKQTGAASP